jgi:hypothetical protein
MLCTGTGFRVVAGVSPHYMDDFHDGKNRGARAVRCDDLKRHSFEIMNREQME